MARQTFRASLVLALAPLLPSAVTPDEPADRAVD
jgi:hypothetical protein